ncbi:SpoIIE family protein phosphatase [Kitasatospora sp. NPDC054939]
MTDDRAAEAVVLQNTVDRLRAEVEGLRRAMRSRAVIEQAKGLLTERLGCTPEEAFGHLAQLSQDGNRKLVDIAADLLGVAAPPGAPGAGPPRRATAPDAGAGVLAEPGGGHWFRSVVDALYDPVLLLTPVREGGVPTDLRVAHAGAATVDPAGRPGRDLVGHRLSELYPGLVAAGTFARLLATAAAGIPYEGRALRFSEVVDGAVHTGTLDLRAVPFPDGLLLTWRSGEGPVRRADRLADVQLLAGLGTFHWTAGQPVLSCSDRALHLLGLDAGPGAADPPTPGRALDAVHPQDRAAVRLLATRLLGGEPRAAVEFDTAAGAGPARTLRVSAEAVTGARDGLRAVRGVVEDVTDRRRTEQALAGARAKLSEQRRRAAAEHRAVKALQQALMELPTAAAPTAGSLDAAARYLPATSGSRIGGDWYDILPLPDGRILLAVGDVSGHGLRAAAGMAHLRHALRGLAHTGTGPGEVLGHLNAMVCHQGGDYIAGVVCGHYDPADRSFTWARAGHLPPALLHGGRAVLLDPPPGPVLGATPQARYRAVPLALAPGDALVLVTDGLLRPRSAVPAEGLAALLRAVEECPAGDAEGCVEYVVGRVGGADPRDDSCLLVARVP